MIKKHVHMFDTADVVLINKAELAKLMDVDVKSLIEDAHKIKPSLPAIPISAKTGEGLPHLINLLQL